LSLRLRDAGLVNVIINQRLFRACHPDDDEPGADEENASKSKPNHIPEADQGPTDRVADAEKLEQSETSQKGKHGAMKVKTDCAEGGLEQRAFPIQEQKHCQEEWVYRGKLGPPAEITE
jgi:hypothetical protein